MNLSGFNCGYALITYTCHDDAQREVRILYARNFMTNRTKEQIKEIFESLKENSVERLKKLKDYGFVYFIERDDALHTMNLMNGREIDDSIVEVTSAKWVDKNQYFRFTRNLSLLIISANLSESLFCASIVFISIYV
ncbi:unnamed protein product [Rotaria magnacalcarata]|uniref:RRM domain-containing protein n=1 Tax=Rotaria magnacalcarata TaxID=392030 RepID=A0A819I234_9BILA|nr:unnamed protein product [Rotaria magnacalcarata]CAF3905266.1 unnamed protein product [Rotaria magnacalcarata]